MTRSSQKNTTTDPNYTQFLELLRSKDQFVQIKAAKDFYQFLLSELKQAKRDDETSYVDNLMKDIKDMANEHNQSMKDKQACIYIITAIINLDNINVKVRKKHSTSLFRILRNVMAYNDPTIIHMASRAMGRYVLAGVDCDVEFKSGLESLKTENKRYQGIQLLRELVLAYPPRLFLHSSIFFENILYSICDPSSQIRYESIELFRLALAEAFKKEAPMFTTGSTVIASPSSSSLNQSGSLRRTSTTSSFNALPDENSLSGSSASNLFQNTPSKQVVSNDKSNSELKKCFMRSLSNLESLVDEASSLTGGSKSAVQSLPRDDQIHGYLLVTLEIVRFACLEFEQRVENYLSTYNLHYQELEQSLNNLTTSLFLNSNINSNYYNLTNGIENTARTCEEMHSLNLLKLLPDSSFDSFQSNDQFTFLFKSEKIKVNVESEFCKKLVADNFDKISRLCLSIVRVLNLSNLSPTMMHAAPSISSLVPSLRCILDTVLELLPRLANFNPSRFSGLYLGDLLSILSNLNANTQFITATSSSSSLTSSISNPLSPSTPSINSSISRRNLFSFMNPSASVSNLAALANSSPTTSITTSISGSSSSASNSNQVILSNVTSSMGTLKSQITFCVGFLSLALASVKNDEFNTFTKNLLEQIKSSPVLNGQAGNSNSLSPNDRKEQINEMNSIMACVAMLSNSTRPEIESIISLIKALMHCSGGITFTMRYFLNEITQHMSELKELVIHENLLEILSQILTGLSHDRLIQTISRSADLLIQNNMSKQTDQIISKTPELSLDTTVQALQTLRSFEFSSIYIIAFLPYFVYYYLQSESRLIKIETVLTVTNLLGKLISKLNESDSRSLVSIVSCVIRKILICAITDPEPDVRYHVLNSLNSNPQFDMFISLPEDLNILFMCVRDERVETRELSATMISRLSTTNSAYILPFIRKILMQLLTEIDIYPDIAQREKSVRLMGHLLSHASRLVSLYIKPLLDCLHSKLNEFRHDISFASSTVTVVGQLASQSSPESIQYFDVIIPFLIESMQNFYYVKLKNMSLWALGQIIANTGYVIEPYKKYPNLLEILLGFLQNETSIQIRRETIRILGLLGAIDPFEYKKALQKNKDSEIEVAAELAAQQIQQQLMLKNAAEANNNNNNANAVNNETSTGANQNATNNNLLVLANLQPGVTAVAQASAIAANLNNNDQTTQDPIEILITTNSLDEYYPALAINFMMKTIKNSPSLTTRKDTIQALVYAVRSLESKCINYVEHIIPPFLDLINSTNDDLANDFITRLGSLINLIKKPIEPYLNSILNIFEKYWNQHGKSQPKMIGSLIDLAQNILNVMDIEFKYYLPRVLPLILKQLKSELYAISSPPPPDSGHTSTTPAVTNVQKILALLRSCSCCLENYINLVLVQFAEYLTSKEITHKKIKQDLMFTIHAFAKQISLGDNCALLFHCFVRILESSDNSGIAAPSKEVMNTNPLLSKSIKSNSQSDQSFDGVTDTITLSPPQQQPPVFSVSYLLFLNSKNGTNTLTNEPLENTTDLATLTLESLYLLARQLGHKYFVFASVVDNILIKSKNYSKLHEQLITNSREACFFMYWNNLKLITDGQVEKRTQAVAATATAGQAQLAETKKPLKNINFGPIKVCVDQVEQLLSRESWRDSFKKFMSAVVAETPVPTLETCSLIPYDIVPTDIFNAAFISVWIKLNQYEQDFIIKYLNSALKNSNVPEIIKIILNLVEFIERCDVNYFLPLDYRLLAEKASQIKAYAKAIHYIEEQIHAIQAASTISSSLISASAASTYNGVGGVLGAGGGGNGNSSTKAIYTTMTSMNQQQQQQTLIYLLEQLVTLNHELQQTEAAEGVLDFSSKYLKTLDSQSKVKIRWYEKLHAWQKALNIYERELNADKLTLEIGKTSGSNQSAYLIGDNAKKVTEHRLELLLGRMRCLKGLGDWQRLNASCIDLLKVLNSLESSSSGHHRQTSLISSPSSSYIGDIVMINPNAAHNARNSDQDTKSFFYQLSSNQRAQLKEKISEIGAAACWGLGDWDQMKDYVNNLPYETNYEGSLYLCVLSLAGSNTNVSHVVNRIEKTRDLLDNDLTSMVSQSYERSYQGVIEAQILVELEEVLKFKQAPFKRDWIEDIWWRRLQGCERSFEYWHRLLLVRSIVLPKEKDIRTWLKFSSLCQKTNHLSLSQHILNSLLRTEESSFESTNSSTGLNQQSLNTLRNLEICKYVYYKSLYANDRKTEAYDELSRLVSSTLKPELIQIQNYQQLQQQQQQMQQQYAINQGAGMNANMVNFQQQNIQFPPYFQLMNPRDLQSRRLELETRVAKCYLKLGQWCSDLRGFNNTTMNEIIAYYEQAYSHNKESYKAWQAWAYANSEAIKLLNNVNPNRPAANNENNPNVPVDPPQELQHQPPAAPAPNIRNIYLRPAILGFFNCIKISSSNSAQEADCLQDTLCLLTLWFDYCDDIEIFEVLNTGIKHTPVEIWLQVIPQLIARIDHKQKLVSSLVHTLLAEIGRVHPQALVFKLILASKLNDSKGQFNSLHGAQPLYDPNQDESGTSTSASQILKSLRETNQTLVEQAGLVSNELIRVAILWNEMWHESLEEASRYYFGEKNTQGMLNTLEILHVMMDRGATTNKETAFMHAYGRDLGEARQFCREYLATNNNRHIELAWEKYYSVFKRLTKQIPQMTSLELSLVSPKLMESRDLELAVPGTYQPNKPLIKIKAFNPNIQIFGTKQRPRKISMFGSNGFEYVFLLKGHEDLRQDERVMQIFGLVNNLLLKNNETARRDLAIQRYNVIPLSQNTGLLQWLLNCDTLHSLIREYREKKRLLLNLEHKIITRLAPTYDHLPAIQKVHIFEMAIESTSGNDLAEILWHKSLNAEKWLERRTNYTRSLAVMSMVGYVLGLGDRHPSNLMLDRVSGKIIHIDFGDCFETAMTREKYPEKIPFRLTRMLKNAMEVTGIEGTFRRTCESVMKVLRINRDSVMAVLEAFVYDPLVYWKLKVDNGSTSQANMQPMPNPNQRLLPNQNPSINNEGEKTEEMNRRAIIVLTRVKDKLAGTDFRNVRAIDEATQVDLLIKQATSSENLCQCFIGWCAWW